MLANDLSLRRLSELRGRAVYARTGERLGTLEQVLYDEDTGQTGWLAIRRGLLRRRVRLAPAGGAALREDGVRLPYGAALVDSAPSIRRGTDVSDARIALYRHYHLTFRGESYPTVALNDGLAPPRRKAAGVVSMRKWVEKRNEQQRVTVQREVLRVRREPMYQPVEGVQLGEQEVQVTLFDEVPVVTKRVVAKERYTMEKDNETQRKKLPDPKKGEGDGAEEYRTPEDPAPEIGDRHDHHFAERERGDRQTA